MRYYEVVFLVHPDQSEQVPAMVERYREIVEGKSGVVHRFEDWGRRQLAYPISTHKEAIYLLMQFVAGTEVPKELDRQFRISDDVIRHLISRQNQSEE